MSWKHFGGLVAAFGLVLFVACDQMPTGSDEVGAQIAPIGLQGASWDEKVTAGGEAVAGGTVFHVSAAASSNQDGAWGEMEYWRTANNGAQALSVHADVACLWVSADLQRAAMSGPVKTVQEDPGGYMDGYDYFMVEFIEDGTGSGDRVGARGTTGLGGANCGAQGAPGTYTDGNVNIRSK